MVTFKNQRILVFGLGLNQGGVGSAKFFASQGAEVRVTDLKNKEVLKPSLEVLKQFKHITYSLGGHKYEDIDWADLIIKNPAVKPGNPYIEYAKKHGKQVEMDMGIFLQFVKPSQIIGITGTKGKSTTSSLIYEVLKGFTHKNSPKSAGVNTNTPQGCTIILAGNIGKSVLDAMPYVKPDTLVVLEISSFQLESFDAHKVSPKWAVITNITPDHLNYYKNMEDYINAKRVIAKYQNRDDFLFLPINLRGLVRTTYEVDMLQDVKSNVIYFSKNNLPKLFHSLLIGNHNLENMAAALAVSKTFGASDKTSLNVLANFKGVPFRMELTKVWHGVKIYNDTTATSPEASIQAIKTLGANLKTPQGCLILICGGMNKGMDYTKYTTILGKFVNKVFFLEGDSTEEVKRQLSAISRQSSDKIAGTYNNLEKLLTDVRTIVKPGDIILFSPAATSFNLFQNEFDRGRKFNTVVEKIFHD